MPEYQLRKYPYPYQSMLAICSDLDETPDKGVYFDTLRYLNTEKSGNIGQGVNLEVGNTLYFHMPPQQFAYWNTDNEGREHIHAAIRSGHIDCFHSFGDLATTREMARQSLEALEANDCKLQVWVDHAQAITNIDAGIMQGSGNIAGHQAYHTDLLIEHGVRYIWIGRVTSVIGQECPRDYRGIINLRHPIKSAITIAKDISKAVLAYRGNQKYALHNGNRLYRNLTLADGNEVTEFIRINPDCAGVSSNETADGFGKVLKKSVLDTLVRKQGVSVLYTHLGKITDRKSIFSSQTRQAFELLAGYQQEQKILTATTKRLLSYIFARENTRIDIRIMENRYICELHYDGPVEDLQGLNVDLPHNYPVQVSVNGKNFTDFECHPHNNGQILSLRWHRLEYPF